jgi:redox-sensitive bicupin YhaK (pirin superfamily)
MRKLIRTIDAVAANDGDGVKIHRIAGRQINSILDPFLMVDEINSDDAADYIGGFPEHPHRGFETITYMKTGRMRHRDHMGNEDVIEAGDVQWMTAGKGVLHSEMPEQEAGLLHGFQIWLNLPANEKMKPAAYRDIRSESITEINLKQGGLVRVVAGSLKVNGKALVGPLPPLSTEPVMLDVVLSSSESVELAFNKQNTALVYVYSGGLSQSGNEINTRQMGVFAEGESLQLRAGNDGVKALVFSGKPLKEPIAQYGPFVMNYVEEVEQAFQDYRDNTLV